MAPAQVREICERALNGRPPEYDDLLELLALPDAETAAPLFATACELRRRHFGDAVFLYGFVYFSTFCRNHCTFCGYRAGNDSSPRYRKEPAEVVEACRELAESGVNLLDLTMGEDPLMHDRGEFETLVELVAAVKQATSLPIMISPGVVPASVLHRLKEAGADFYACYQETHTPSLFARLRVGQSFERRVEARIAAHREGLLVEDGLLVGVGETDADRARSLFAMQSARDQQVRVMTLVPQRDTPLGRLTPPSTLAELLLIAAMRLLMPARLIPASLDVEGIEGLRARLEAGANVVTSLVPPSSGLCGVANAEFEVDEGLRSAAQVRPRLAELGLRQGTAEEYAEWLDAARVTWSDTVRGRTA